MGWYFPKKTGLPPKKGIIPLRVVGGKLRSSGYPEERRPAAARCGGPLCLLALVRILRRLRTDSSYNTKGDDSEKNGPVPPPKKTGPPPTLERASNRPSGAVRSRANRLMFMSGFFQTGTPPQSRAKGEAAPEKRMEMPPLIRKNIRKFGLPSGLQPGGKLREGSP